MLISRDVFTKVGLFYEQYFLYFEETDFCLRAKRCRYDLSVYLNSRVWHKVGASSGGGITPLSFYYFIKNRFRFLKRFLNLSSLAVAIMYLCSIRIWIDLMYSLTKSEQKREILLSFLKGLQEGIVVLSKEKRLE